MKSIPAACGKCYECRRKKVREWRIRIEWEMRTNPIPAKAVTLSFSDEALDKLPKDNHEATARAIRLFVKRWVKEKGRTIRHYLVNELGKTNTERLHLHGIVWTNDWQDIERIWGYGNVKIEPASENAVGYITKYIHKPDELHPGFFPKIFASKGIGSGFINSYTAKKMAKEGPNAKQYLKTKKGEKIDIPMYYRRKLWNDDQREQIWCNLLDKQERYVRGQKIDISSTEGYRRYFQALEYQQKETSKLGYSKEPWSKKKYTAARKKLGENLEN